MANATSLRVLPGTAGTCRRRRRPQGSARPEWVRPYRRVQRDLDVSLGLIDSSYRAATVSEKWVASRPVGTSVKLSGATRRLGTALRRLMHAAGELAEARRCLERVPGCRDQGSELVALAAERWEHVVELLKGTAVGVAALHLDVLAGLATGELVPERTTGRPRIVPAPRPVPIRAFLAARTPRVADRIASILSRRRRTPRPAALRVPRRHLRGRAPPLSSICLL